MPRQTNPCLPGGPSRKSALQSCYPPCRPASHSSHCSCGKCSCRRSGCKNGCGKVQVIQTAEGHISPCADTVVIDRIDWKSDSTNGRGFLKKCALFELPKCAKNGRRVVFYNHHNAISILQHPFPLGKDESGNNVPRGSPDSNAEFWHITLGHHDDVVELEWIDYNHGWTIINRVGDVHVTSLRGVSPKYIYSLCTLRRMNGDYSTNYMLENVPTVTPPNVPRNVGLRDFVSVVDLEPSSVNYGKIVYKAFGVRESGADEELEYHHGDLLDIDGQIYIAAPSLNFRNSAIDFFALDSPNAPTLSSYVSADQAARGESEPLQPLSLRPQASAFHTTHQNHQTGKIIISSLGSAFSVQGDFGRDSGPGGFVEVSEDTKTYVLEGLSSLSSGPYPQTIANYEKLTGTDANGVPYSPYNAANLDPSAEPVLDEFQYDFVINDCTNTLVCTSWGPPSSFDSGFATNRPYGVTIRVLKMPDEGDKAAHNPGQPAGTPHNLTVAKTFETSFDLANGGEGVVPLEVRRTHVPGDETYFVGVTLPGALDLVYQDSNGQWQKEIIVTPADLVAHCTDASVVTDAPSSVPLFGELPIPLVTDITLSEDDRFLYVSCWLAGVLLQYDVRDPKNPVLVGGIGNLGGVTAVTPGTNSFNPNSYLFAAGKRYAGGPQMLRLDPAGYNIYVTNSLFSSWDDEFFPQASPPSGEDGSILTNGGMMIKLDTGVRRGERVGPMEIDVSFGEQGVIQYKDLQVETPDGLQTFTSRVHEGHIVGVRH